MKTITQVQGDNVIVPTEINGIQYYKNLQEQLSGEQVLLARAHTLVSDTTQKIADLEAELSDPKYQIFKTAVEAAPVVSKASVV